MKSDERTYWVAWSTIPKVGPTLLLRIQRTFGTLRVAWNASSTELCQVEGIGPQTAAAIAQARHQVNPGELLQTYERNNPSFWTPADGDYPKLLLEMPDPPPVLYYRGQVLPEENQGIRPLIAVVGTREPSAYGKRWAERIVKTLTQAGFTIVSGLAAGIDAIAHKSCLASSGRTIAVVGTGVNIVYPWSNRKLAEQIIGQGLMVSEYPAGTKPDMAHFPQRNRIIAGLCRATLVIEAPPKSGALITARMANDYGRDVYALPGSLDDVRSYGCLRLISQGAHLILNETNLLEMLGTIPHFHTEYLSPHQGASELDQPTTPHEVMSQAVDLNPVAQRQLLPLGSTPPSDVAPSGQAHQATVIENQPSPESVAIDLEPKAQQVLDSINTNDLISLDTIVQRCQLPTGETLALLVQLELMGLVSQSPGMMYQRH